MLIIGANDWFFINWPQYQHSGINLIVSDRYTGTVFSVVIHSEHRSTIIKICTGKKIMY